MTPRELGCLGEDLAAKHLAALGWAVLERNVRLPGGEIDLVAREGDELVLVEVRTRSESRLQEASDTVGPEKLRRLVRAGRTYVARRRYDGFWRIDLLALDRTGSGWSVHHHRDITGGRYDG